LCSTKDKLVIHLMWKIVPSEVSPAGHYPRPIAMAKYGDKFLTSC
jgi:hypothetical protein